MNLDQSVATLFLWGDVLYYGKLIKRGELVVARVRLKLRLPMRELKLSKCSATSSLIYRYWIPLFLPKFLMTIEAVWTGQIRLAPKGCAM